MRVVSTTLGALAEAMEAQSVANPAIILIRCLKTMAHEVGATAVA